MNGYVYLNAIYHDYLHKELGAIMNLNFHTTRQMSTCSYKYAYFPRTVLDWNNLAENIVNSSTLGTFKLKLHSN